uniref:Reticulocalbin-3 n=1 Tax=Strigamia maritima TaxID=126957 RepID=T1J078_STRMM
MSIVMAEWSYRLQILTLILSTIFVSSTPHAHRSNLMRERESDGAFSPKDKYHYTEGEHNSDFDHEAILGSRDVAEEFHQLSPEEAKKRLKEIVLKMDKNSDGSVDKNELINWVLQSFKLLSLEESKERLEEADADEDGRVSWAEYISETYGISDDDESLNSQDLAEEQKMLKEDDEIFKVSDLNSDGYLSENEFLAFTHPEEHEHTLRVVFKRTMVEKDLDKDGTLTFQEFIGTEGKQHDKDWILSEKDRFDNDFDRNKDGHLNNDEILLWLIPNSRDAAEQEAEHLIQTADDDMNSQLSMKEILDNHDVFVGSEITDFGQHLHNTAKFNDEL